MEFPPFSASLSLSGFFDDNALDCDVGLFMKAFDLVAGGVVTGARVSRFLERLALRLEAAAEVGTFSDKSFARAAYYALVAEFEKRLGYPPVDLRLECAELHALHVMYADPGRVPYGAALPAELPFRFAAVAGGAVALAVPTDGEPQQVPPDQLVLVGCVYRALLALDVVSDESVLFRVKAGDGGVLSFVTADSSSATYTLQSLPDGLYSLPGGAGCLVTKSVISAVLGAVWVQSRRQHEPGYCYLRVLPPLQRDSASQLLGPYPTVKELTDVCPTVYTWSTAQARVDTVSDGHSRDVHYHVSSVGTLPVEIPMEGRLGGPPPFVREGRGPDMPDHFQKVFDTFEAQVARGDASRGRSASSVSASSGLSPPPAFGRQGHSRSPSASSLALGGELVPRRTQTPVFRLRPGGLRATGPVWIEPDEPVVKEWCDRLASGPPVGTAALHALSKANRDSLPSPVVAEGGQVIAVSPAQVVGSAMARWESRVSPLPGWSFERMRGTNGNCSSVSAVPPYPGALCRYEVSSDGPVEVNTVVIPGTRSAFWVDGSVTITQLRGTVWRVWHEGGSAALGLNYMALQMGYQYPAILPARRSRSTFLHAKLYGSDESRGESLYRAVMPVSPGEGEVNLYVGDSVASEAVVVTVTAPGLVRISVHKVTVPAAGSVAAVVTDLASLRLAYVVGSYRGGTCDGKIVFEIRRTRGIGPGAGRVVSQRLLMPPSSSSGASDASTFLN